MFEYRVFNLYSLYIEWVYYLLLNYLFFFWFYYISYFCGFSFVIFFQIFIVQYLLFFVIIYFKIGNVIDIEKSIVICLYEYIEFYISYVKLFYGYFYVFCKFNCFGFYDSEVFIIF